MTGARFAGLFSRFKWVAMAAVTGAGCRGNLSPLSNKITVGEEAYAVFAGDGEAGQGDLYAVSAAGGPVFRVTFSRVDESSPVLSPDGGQVAFLRSQSIDNPEIRNAWILNLVNGAEREMPIPEGRPVGLAWSPDGRTLYIRTSGRDFRADAPPAPPAVRPVAASERIQADSAFRVWVGDPVFARVGQCPDGDGVCSFDAGDHPSVVARPAHDAVRWGPDSLGYLVGEQLYVRPLGAGTTRRVSWERAPAHPRSPFYFGPRRP